MQKPSHEGIRHLTTITVVPPTFEVNGIRGCFRGPTPVAHPCTSGLDDPCTSGLDGESVATGKAADIFPDARSINVWEDKRRMSGMTRAVNPPFGTEKWSIFVRGPCTGSLRNSLLDNDSPYQKRCRAPAIMAETERSGWRREFIRLEHNVATLSPFP